MSKESPPLVVVAADGRRGVRSFKAIGALLDPPRAHSTVQGWRKKYPDSFPRKTDGLYSLDDIEEWRRNTLRPEKMPPSTVRPDDSDDQDEYTERQRLELEKLRETARLTRLRADELAGRKIDRALHNSIMVSYVKLVRSKIEEWCEGLPPQFEGLPVPDIRELLREAYDRLCTDMYHLAFVTPASDKETSETIPPDPKKAKAGRAGMKARFGKKKDK